MLSSDNLISKLMKWRKDFLGDDSNLDSKTLSEFADCLVGNFDSLKDSPQRRELVYFAEKIVMSRWQECNYRTVDQDVFYEKLLKFFEEMQKIEFSKGDFFKLCICRVQNIKGEQKSFTSITWPDSNIIVERITPLSIIVLN